MLKNHSMSPRGVFAGLLPPDGEVVDSVQQWQAPLKQFIMDNPLHIPPGAQHCRARSGMSLVKIALLEVRKPFLACSFSNRVFSIDSTNVLGGLCRFGGSI
jgi:hypothetical protein